MKPKHLVQVSAYYPPHLGGQENAVYDLVRQLFDAGYEVDVLTSTCGGGEAGQSNENGATITRLKGPVFGHAPIMPAFPTTLMRTARPDSVVHVHIGQAFTPEIVWLISRLRGFKYIAQLHIDFEASGPAGVLLPFYKKVILRRVLQSAAAVVTLNSTTQDVVRTEYGYKGQIHVLNNGLDNAYFTLPRAVLGSQPPQKLQLLFVGRLTKQKNIAALLNAMRKTKRNVHLDIIGEGEEYLAIHDFINDYGIDATLHGRLSRKEVQTFYQTCDALVMPSLYEAQPLVLLEAMAARIPIIATAVSGIEEHIGDAGILVPPTTEGLVDGIEQYYTQYSQWPERVEHAFCLAEELSWEHTLEKYEALYDKVVQT